VFSMDLMELYAEVLLETGTRHAMIVHSMTEEGIALDEPSLNGPTHIIEIFGGVAVRHTVNPEDFGLERHALSEIQGGDKHANAEIIRKVLDGSASQAYIDAALYTSAMACYVSGRAGCVDDGFTMSMDALESGRAQRKLNEILQVNADISSKYKPAAN
ncbi:MAG: anthranilate phosphoribosyltransferase, partial [Chlorobiaceae bacterium]|nr:anthranilate phosphoribosyltransferase [Chlorobiaceae bacterium]